MRAKPVELHRRSGTYRPDRHARPRPGADLAAPSMPAGLSKLEQAAWRQIVASLKILGTLHSADAALIETGAAVLGRARECRAVLKKEGLVVRGDRGSVVHPAARLEQQAVTSWRLIASELGLSPTARARLGIEGDVMPPGYDPIVAAIGRSPRVVGGGFVGQF